MSPFWVTPTRSGPDTGRHARSPRKTFPSLPPARSRFSCWRSRPPVPRAPRACVDRDDPDPCDGRMGHEEGHVDCSGLGRGCDPPRFRGRRQALVAPVPLEQGHRHAVRLRSRHAQPQGRPAQAEGDDVRGGHRAGLERSNGDGRRRPDPSPSRRIRSRSPSSAGDTLVGRTLTSLPPASGAARSR